MLQLMLSCPLYYIPLAKIWVQTDEADPAAFESLNSTDSNNQKARRVQVQVSSAWLRINTPFAPICKNKLQLQ